MGSSLPMFVVLKSKYNSKYLEYVKEGPVQGYVRFTGEDVHSPLSKFQVQPAESDHNLVHLRCCYNNKYLVARQGWLVSEADKPEEDQWKRTCTLLRCTPVGGGGGGGDYMFTHVNTRFWPRLMDTGDDDPKKNCLVVTSGQSDSFLQETFNVIDWASLVVLPRHVAFKGDNGSYLGVLYTGGLRYLRFGIPDAGHSTVAHEVFPNPDGSIRLKSTDCGQFWRRSPDWIWPDSDDTSINSKDTHFWPVKLDDKTIALRNLGNDQFCKSLTADDKTDCLNASDPTISKYSRLQVEELVLSREIYNVQFHPGRAKRYNEHPIVMGSGSASNTTNKENSIGVKVDYTKTESSSWTGSVSFTLGVKTTLVTKVPLIAEGKIEISAELTAGYEWGKVYTNSNTVETVYNALVPPMTKVTVFAVGSTATCDVPYSYTQTDTLMDGTRRTYQMDDGMYTGINSFNVTYDIVHESIRVN